jgi:hypothetical protein
MVRNELAHLIMADKPFNRFLLRFLLTKRLLKIIKLAVTIKN